MLEFPLRKAGLPQFLSRLWVSAQVSTLGFFPNCGKFTALLPPQLLLRSVGLLLDELVGTTPPLANRIPQRHFC